jgi:hypothetical protein
MKCEIEEEYNQEEYKEFTTNNGVLKSIYAKNYLEIKSIEDSMAQNSDLSEIKIEKIIKYFIDNNLKVGFISSLEVDEKSLGNGEGRNLMNQFQNKIMKKTDVDILLSRSNNKQKEGFVLEEFYMKYGFKSIILEDGDMLMVTKGYDIILEDLLELNKERELVIDYYEKNIPENQIQKDIFKFMKSKIEESVNKNLRKSHSKIK